MSSACAGSLLTYLSQVPDPRGRKGRRHCLSAILTAVVCGVLCGVRGYEDLVEWLHGLPVDVWHWMGYTRRPPKKDCFRDLLMAIDPAVLEKVLRAWIETDLNLDMDVDELSGVSIDGKTLCATLRVFERAVHLLSMVDHRTGCVLSQCRVDEKTNEHKAALPLLKEMVLHGRVVVGDAMFCQRDLCAQIVEAQGDYLVSVKENQPTLLREIQLEFHTEPSGGSPYGQRERPADRQTVSTLDKGHGRLERRTLTSTTSLSGYLDWPGSKQVCRLERERTISDQKTTEVAYFVTSLSRSQANAATLLSLIRDHWGAIENGVHYVRDEAFAEDRCTIFRGHAPQNFAAIRNTALNLLRRLGLVKVTATLRSFTRNPLRLLSILGYRN